MKIMIVAFIFSFSCCTALAAENRASIGILGLYSDFSATSFAFTTASSNLNTTDNPTSGYGGGLVGNLPLGSGRFGLELRVLYVTEYVNTSGSGNLSTFPATVTTTTNFSFIQIPLVVNMNLVSGLALHAGGFFALATGTISGTENLTVNGHAQAPINISNPNTNNDYGFVGGVEYMFRLAGTTKFLVSADYLYGVANLNSGITTYSASSSRIIQGAAGVLFSL